MENSHNIGNLLDAHIQSLAEVKGIIRNINNQIILEKEKENLLLKTGSLNEIKKMVGKKVICKGLFDYGLTFSLYDYCQA